MGIKEIAKKAQVSPSTVSIILNNRDSSIPISASTREQVLRVAQETNYVPDHFARALRQQRSNVIGVVIWDLTDEFFTEIFAGIESTLRLSNYMMMVAGADQNPDALAACLETFRSIRANGVLIVDGPKESLGNDVLQAAQNVPVVLVGFGSDQLSSVYVDSYLGATDAMNYLLSLKRQEVLYFGTPRTPSTAERLRGVTETIEQHGAQGSFRFIEAEVTEEGGYSAADTLFRSSPRLSKAILAQNDHVALGVLRAAREHGIAVPSEVAIMGFDDLSFARFTDPPISTVKQPRFEMGRLGAEILLQQTEDGGKNASRVLQSEIIVRGSA